MTAHRPTVAAVLLILVLSAGILAPGCGPQQAALRVTVQDENGKPVPGLEVRATGKTVATDAGGVAAISGLVPGTAEITVTGGGYFERRSETLRPGLNRVTIQLAPRGLGLRDPSLAERLRLRFTISASGQTEIVEAEIIRGQGSRWKFTGAEFIAVGGVVYFKSEAAWQKLEGPAGMLGMIFTSMAEGLMRGFNDVVLQVMSATGVEVNSRGAGVANGYPCAIYDVKASAAASWSDTTVYVISSGEYTGFPTRVVFSNPQGEKTTVDLYDFGALFQIKAPF